MKVFRILAIVIAVAIPTAAVANHVMASDDCCDGGNAPCCKHGCPLCHHHAK